MISSPVTWHLVICHLAPYNLSPGTRAFCLLAPVILSKGTWRLVTCNCFDLKATTIHAKCWLGGRKQGSWFIGSQSIDDLVWHWHWLQPGSWHKNTDSFFFIRNWNFDIFCQKDGFNLTQSFCFRTTKKFLEKTKKRWTWKSCDWDYDDGTKSYPIIKQWRGDARPSSVGSFWCTELLEIERHPVKWHLQLPV